MRKVKLFSPNVYTKEWLSELKKVFKSGQLAQGPKVKKFEEMFCKVFDYDYAVAVNSGTAAVELAYLLAGIKEGDKVFTPVLTCSATNLPLIHRKANIEFIDINNKLTMDYYDFNKKIVDNHPAAVITVNLGGVECDNRIYYSIEEINRLSNKHIPVIIDACQSLGIHEPNGDYICYSFQAIKHFTAGNGGMLIVKNKEDYERAKALRWFGIDRDRRQKMNFNFSPSNREICMNMPEPGFKMEMDDISATMGLVGLRHTDEAMYHRKNIANVYIDKFQNKIKYVVGSSYWLFCILLEDRDEGKMDKIKEAGVACDLVHLRNDIFTPFGGQRLNLPNMNKIESQYLYIPIHSQMTLKDAKYVADIILEVK